MSLGTPMLSVEARRALRRAEAHRIPIRMVQMKAQWICTVDGEVAHINDLPKLVDAAIARQRQEQAA